MPPEEVVSQVDTLRAARIELSTHYRPSTVKGEPPVRQVAPLDVIRAMHVAISALLDFAIGDESGE